MWDNIVHDVGEQSSLKMNPLPLSIEWMKVWVKLVDTLRLMGTVAGHRDITY
jgi:hypothetical protein